ncbi:MAG: OmpA family protein, partial [bacterium]
MTLILAALASCGKQHVRTAYPAPRALQADALPALRVHFPAGGDDPVRGELAFIVRDARWISENPDAVIVLEGHCDERGGDAFNLELGDRRARSVAELLARNGADPSRIVIVSQGER